MAAVAGWLALVLALALAVVASDAKWAPTQCGPANQTTRWTSKVDPRHVLPEYPRPQMVRGPASWHNLNGLWQYQPSASGDESVPYGKQLSSEILVPFPVESCLSGIGKVTTQWHWYRLVFDRPAAFSLASTWLRFGAVDWQSFFYFNGALIGYNTGGYNGFAFDISKSLRATGNELIVHVYDPSDDGVQPNGKQRLSAITDPGSDTYTPSSGIWQTVWLENVLAAHIVHVLLETDTRLLTLQVEATGSATPAPVTWRVIDSGKPILTGDTVTGAGGVVSITIPHAKLWEPRSPFLYGLELTLGSGDSVYSYFAMRSIGVQHVMHPAVPGTGMQVGVDRPGSDMPGFPIVQEDPSACWKLCNTTVGCIAWAYGVASKDCDPQPRCWLKSSAGGTMANKCRISGVQPVLAGPVIRPVLNGGFLFMAGWLDQSYWPDGQYTAPTDEALASDLVAVGTFGFNTVRLHQKVNPERWYWHADRLGVIVLQDMIQKYGSATAATVPFFYDDMRHMISGKKNHPCIVQWTLFNEDDCWKVFNVSEALAVMQSLDATRLIDFNSGGGANHLGLADVNDIHTYPWPGDTKPTKTQYGMIGEFGGAGAFVAGKEWVTGKCGSYLNVDTPEDQANTYIQMAKMIQSIKKDISVSIWTQITDLELECEGFLNYDRSSKFDAVQTRRLWQANQDLIYKNSAAGEDDLQLAMAAAAPPTSDVAIDEQRSRSSRSTPSVAASF